MGRHVKIAFSDFSADFASMVPIKDIAQRFGVCAVTVYGAVRAAGATRKRAYKAEPERVAAFALRSEHIHQAFMAGLTMTQIGEIHGMTRERVRQILKKQGFAGPDGGQSLGARAKRVARAAAVAKRRDMRCLQSYGCSYAAIESICGAGVELTKHSATRKYAQQTKNAAARGVEFSMTFPQWWAVWQASGKWNERGRGMGYVMARTGDVGPYAIGNVYICTQSQNSKDSYLKTPASVRSAKRASNPNVKNGLGTGRGWIFDKKCAKNPYRVIVRGRLIGGFPTEQLARDAYLAEVGRIKAVGVQPVCCNTYFSEEKAA